jgi:hypothetical protein
MIKSASNRASSGALQNMTNAASNWPAKPRRKGARRHHPGVRDHDKPPYRHQLRGRHHETPALASTNPDTRRWAAEYRQIVRSV